MEFDFARISVPFRMQPGLVRLAPDALHLTPLQPGSQLHAEKLAIHRLGTSCRALPGFDATVVLPTIRAQVLRAGVSQQDADTLALDMQVEEDLVILDTRTAQVPWMCVSVPSRWAPEEKLGRTLPELHRPVADGEALAAALPHILRVLSNGTHWERHVWTLTPCSFYDQHPQRQPLVPWPDDAGPDELARQCYLRAERQTFIPVLDSAGQPGKYAVFTIRVMLAPLDAALRSPADALRLHDALASMSSAVLTYKNLTPARDRLLRWLARRAATATSGAAPLV